MVKGRPTGAAAPIDYLTDGSATFLVKVPAQRRARDTFNRIVSAAVDLLLDAGISCLNTNAVAERAGVNVASVYSYFRNKESIVYFLAEYYENSRVALVAAGADHLSERSEWRTILAEIIDAMVSFRIDHPGCVVVRRAVESLPDSPDFDGASTQQAAEVLSRAFVRLGRPSPAQQLEKIARFYADTVTVTVDREFSVAPYDSEAIGFLKEMSVAWLATYVSGDRDRL